MTESAPRAITLGVEGMTCTACQVHVEKALRETEGVTEASVNLMTHSARVVYHPAVTELKALVEAVREAGYDASLATAQSSDTPTSTTTLVPNKSALCGFAPSPPSRAAL